MQKELLIKLAEALALVDFKIVSLEWTPSSHENPSRETVNLKILKTNPYEKKP